MSVILTEKAAQEIKRVISEQNQAGDACLRIGVSGGGCSGFNYNLRLDSTCDETTDYISEQHGVKVAVDKKSHLFLDGTKLDFYDGLEKRGFTFENPNAVKSCGCGNSFSA